MKQYLKLLIAIISLFVLLLIFLGIYNVFYKKTDLLDSKNITKSIKINSGKVNFKKYQEFFTSFTEDIGTWDGKTNQDEEIKKFIKNTGKEKFWSSNENLYLQNSKPLKDNSEKSDVKIPDGYGIKWGTFLYIDENNNQYNFFTKAGKDFLFINEGKVEIGKIIDGADGGVQNVSLINGKISFLYRKNDMSDKDLQALYDCYEKYSNVGGVQARCGDEKFHWEYFYGEPNFSQKVDVDAVSKIFEYNGKIGFVGEKNGKWAVYFDKEKISENFDEIRTTACCAIRTFPFEIYNNGVVFFMGRRGDQYILAESRL